VDRLARHDARRLDVGQGAGLGLDRALAIDRIAKAVYDAAQKFIPDRYVNDRLGSLDGVAFLDLAVRAKDHDADIVGL
jgi:hypothetical protein